MAEASVTRTMPAPGQDTDATLRACPLSTATLPPPVSSFPHAFGKLIGVMVLEMAEVLVGFVTPKNVRSPFPSTSAERLVPPVAAVPLTK
jgi:hypothetical protein